MNKSIWPVAALLLLSSNAFAASENWEGFYAGGNFGYGWGTNKDSGNPDAVQQNIDGATAGFQAGHNWQFENNIVLGVELGLSANGITKEWKDRDNVQFSPYYGEDQINQSGSLNLKVGYAIDKFLPYVTAGVTVASVEYSLGCNKSLVSETNGCKTAEFNTSTSDIRAGANVGVGVMYKFNENMSGGIEYMYTNLGSSSVSLNDPNYPAASERNMKTDYSTVTARLNYHF